MAPYPTQMAWRTKPRTKSKVHPHPSHLPKEKTFGYTLPLATLQMGGTRMRNQRRNFSVRTRRKNKRPKRQKIYSGTRIRGTLIFTKRTRRKLSGTSTHQVTTFDLRYRYVHPTVKNGWSRCGTPKCQRPPRKARPKKPNHLQRAKTEWTQRAVMFRSRNSVRSRQRSNSVLRPQRSKSPLPLQKSN